MVTKRNVTINNNTNDNTAAAFSKLDKAQTYVHNEAVIDADFVTQALTGVITNLTSLFVNTMMSVRDAEDKRALWIASLPEKEQQAVLTHGQCFRKENFDTVHHNDKLPQNIKGRKSKRCRHKQRQSETIATSISSTEQTSLKSWREKWIDAVNDMSPETIKKITSICQKHGIDLLELTARIICG